jgi:hypothetical protein
MRDKREKSSTPGSEPPAPDAIELPERWSVQRKTELVLRVLCGASRSTPSLARSRFRPTSSRAGNGCLEHGTRGLKSRSEPDERELTLARAKIGELMMRLELAEHLIEKRGFADEWKKQRR